MSPFQVVSIFSTESLLRIIDQVEAFERIFPVLAMSTTEAIDSYWLCYVLSELRASVVAGPLVTQPALVLVLTLRTINQRYS